MNRAQIHGFLTGSVRIQRNRILDAIALGNRNVIIPRRGSVAIERVEPAPRMAAAAILNRRYSAMPDGHGSLMQPLEPLQLPQNIVPRANNNALNRLNARSNSPIVEGANDASSINEQQIDGDNGDINSRQKTQQENVDVDGMDSENQPSSNPKTAFPGLMKKTGRKSYFKQKQMDEYVKKLQPYPAQGEDSLNFLAFIHLICFEIKIALDLNFLNFSRATSRTTESYFQGSNGSKKTIVNARRC